MSKLFGGKRPKKDVIIELIENEKKNPKEVANMLDTSESYVNKVMSFRRKELPILSDSKSEEASMLINPDVGGTNKQMKVRTTSIQLPSMTPDIRKLFYGWIDPKPNKPIKPIVDFIKRTGVEPALVEREYNAYLKLKGADRFELQKMLLALVDGVGDSGSPISDETNGLLTNTFLVEQMKIRIDDKMSTFVDTMLIQYLLNPGSPLPPSVSRPKCDFCEKEVEGVLVTEALQDDHLLKDINTVSLCTNCRKVNREWLRVLPIQ